MFCKICGKELPSNGLCSCQQQAVWHAPTQTAPHYAPPRPQSAAAGFFKKITINQWLVLGACLLLVLSLFFPVMVSYSEPVMSGFTAAFGGIGLGGVHLAYFIQLVGPILAMGAVTLLLRDKKRQLVGLCVSVTGLIFQLLMMLNVGMFNAGMSWDIHVGACLVISLIIWALLTALSLLDYLNIDIVKKMTGFSQPKVFCPSCHAVISLGVNFCPNCGKPLPQVRG